MRGTRVKPMVEMNTTMAGVTALNAIGNGSEMVIIVMIVLVLALGAMFYSLWRWWRWAIKGAGIILAVFATLGGVVGILILTLVFLRDRAQEIVYEQNYTLPLGLAVFAVFLCVAIALGKWSEGKSRIARWLQKIIK
jgi:uncharacterized protein YacL